MNYIVIVFCVSLFDNNRKNYCQFHHSTLQYIRNTEYLKTSNAIFQHLQDITNERFARINVLNHPLVL